MKRRQTRSSRWENLHLKTNANARQVNKILAGKQMEMTAYAYNPGLRRQRQEGQKLKVVLSYVASLVLAWVT